MACLYAAPGSGVSIPGGARHWNAGNALNAGGAQYHVGPRDRQELDRGEPGLTGPAAGIQLRTAEIRGSEPGVDAVPDHGTLPDQEDPTAEEVAQGAGLGIGDPDRRQELHEGEPGELSGVDRAASG